MGNRKLIFQHDEKDCGAACLASIMAYYNKRMPISRVRDIVRTDDKGTSIYGLVEGAKKLGFSAKAYKASKDVFQEKLPFPAIAHVLAGDNLNRLHYVVIYGVKGDYIKVGDPAKGIIKMNLDDFYKIWTGNIIFMSVTKNFIQENEVKGSFSRFLLLLKPQKYLLFNIFLMSLVLTMLGIITSFYFKFIMDEIIPSGLRETLTTISLLFLALYIIQSLIGFFRAHLLLYLSRRIDVPLILGYYDHVVDLPMSFYSRRKVGEIVSRFQDASKIKSAISGAALTIMLDLLLIIGGGVVLFLINNILFMIATIMVFLYAITTWIFFKPFKKANREIMENGSNVTSYLVESLQGAETIKAFNYEDKVKNETEKRYIDLIYSGHKMGKLGNLQAFIKGIITSLGGLFIIWFGVVQVMDGKITLGELITFNALLAYFITPLQNVINLQTELQTAFVSAERLSEIIDLELEKSKEDEKLQLTSINDITFNNVKYRYGARSLVLDGVSFNLKKGTTTAIVGETGSGKSTIAKLLLNYYQIEEGEILINNKNILDISRTNLRSMIAYIPQETFLFGGTIRENLSIGKKVSDEEMFSICKDYLIDDFVNRMPMRYESYVEERGANLSGGQKQRISIARAMLKKPDLIIMDEATSSLDANTEKIIMKLINENIDVSKIIIAHRLTTIKNATNIIVMADGKVIEAGNHNDLVLKNGKYAELWLNQNGGHQ